MRAGEWVQIRSKDEILATLDKSGQLDRLPFMPEMFQFCGQRFRVFRRAHKTCDPPNGLLGRRMSKAVHLEDLRCGGEAHGGCQARCLFFWKEAWLQRVDDNGKSPTGPLLHEPLNTGQPAAYCGCTEQDVLAGTRSAAEQENSDEPTYVCQSTQLSQATQPLYWWDLRQYVEDYTSGNARVSQLLAAFLFFVYDQLASAGLGLGALLRGLYDAVQKIRGGTPYPSRFGDIAPGARTPGAKLDVRPGDLVKIRSYRQILATINEQGHNRGMVFDPEMVPYCGGTYRVLDRVTRIINEKTGKMQHLKNDCIMLEKVVCLARYAKYRRFCSRSIYAYWREVWLERVAPNTSSVARQG